MRATLTRTIAAPPSARLLVLIEEIQARLAPVCAETPTDLFNEMVLRIAHVQLASESAPIP